jgi:aryl-alcohol dehydrogenase-like predicted oxidoreductase
VVRTVLLLDPLRSASDRPETARPDINGADIAGRETGGTETALVASALGFGCASLGSRIAEGQGRRLLEAAFERGVTWFDVAPSYGAGRAEAILKPFLAAHRAEVTVCSKVGLAPPRHNGLLRLVYDLARPVAGVAQGLRRRFRAVGATRNVRVPLTPELIETSIVGSLARLGTDHLDVYALHDPDPADLGRDAVIDALVRVKARGLARHIAVAGSFAAARAAAAVPVVSILQLADDPAVAPLPRLRALLDRPVGFVTHSVIGVGGARDRVAAAIRRADAALAADLAAAGYAGPPEAAAAKLLVRRAFASNAGGVVLMSMFSGSHLADNAALADAPDPAAAALLARLGIGPNDQETA